MSDITQQRNTSASIDVHSTRNTLLIVSLFVMEPQMSSFVVPGLTHVAMGSQRVNT